MLRAGRLLRGAGALSGYSQWSSQLDSDRLRSIGKNISRSMIRCILRRFWMRSEYMATRGNEALRPRHATTPPE